MAPAFPRVQAAAIDGRFDTIYHRQVELESLCKALIDNVNEIKQAIAADSGHTPAEVAVEYHRALSAVKRDYATLEPVKAHEQEYLIANGKDASHRRTPAGVVYIEPTTHTLFYSTIAPLSAALAAGNTVIVLVSTSSNPYSCEGTDHITAGEQSARGSWTSSKITPCVPRRRRRCHSFKACSGQ